MAGNNDKERIERLLNKLKAYWENNQDLRLGQIICRANREITNRKDSFFMPDGGFEEWLDEKNKERKEQALDEMVEQSQELGLYEITEETGHGQGYKTEKKRTQDEDDNS